MRQFTVRTKSNSFLNSGKDKMKAQFLDLHAAADFLGPGAVEVNRYQNEITDIVRRRGIFGQRIRQVPATGHPSRFFEQTAISAPTAATGFVDPRNIVATIANPTRSERSVPLKALVSQIKYNLSTWKWDRSRANSLICRPKTWQTRWKG
jgi:hypothetical protein